MGVFDLFGKKKDRVVLIVQCRLSSTRLPRKALLPLGGFSILEWVLASMKKVPCDAYYLAVDSESAPELEFAAKKCGWNFFAGSKEDVLDRFCKTIEVSKADIVVRATADNPFLFYDAASELLEEYKKRKASSSVDYITWTGLPHGSGIEIFSAQALLEASKLRNLTAEDHEHVGPALYKHQDHFNCLFLKSPSAYHYPDLRTTIDTASDYRRALAFVRAVSSNKAKTTDTLLKKNILEPYTSKEIIRGMQIASVKYPMILIPSTKKGAGTGHLRRCLDLACKTGADIYVPEDCGLEQSKALLEEAYTEGLQKWQLVSSLENISSYNLAVTDLFRTDEAEAKKISMQCPVASIDEGALETEWADYLLDIIPSLGYTRKPNLAEPGFIILPKNRRSEEERSAKIHTALVVLGGEDPASLAFPSAIALAECGLYVTAIAGDASKAKVLQDQVPENLSKYIRVIEPVINLREKLFEFDLVVTHYGFTAFEASAAGCAVILLGTTPLHESLAEKYSFKCVQASLINKESFQKLLADKKSLYRDIKENGIHELDSFMLNLSQGTNLCCPVCREEKKSWPKDPLIARTPERTFRRCQKCGMLYMSWTIQSHQTEYNHDYFYDDYKKQYGKTYQDDFENIKAQCVRRVSIIDFIYRRGHSSVTPTVLDIGCALGPFLDAANDSGWHVFGTDISKDAVEYVQNTLHYPALLASFPDADVAGEFGVDKFDAVTMWYVIEHFQDLDSVLKAVSKIVKKGGIFAFSTPSAAGVSEKYNTDDFFAQSPADHYTLWEPKRCASILRKYGFKVVRTVSTGIHPERFPSIKKSGSDSKSLKFRMYKTFSMLFKLGDTFEVYCRKVN